MTDDSYRGKVRATFLAAIMVLSMVAMAATLAAPAAATAPEDFDGADLEGETLYSGKSYNITVGTGSGSGGIGADSGGDTVYLLDISFDGNQIQDYTQVASYAAVNEINGNAISSSVAPYNGFTANDLLIEDLDLDNRDQGNYALSTSSASINTDQLINFTVQTVSMDAEFEDETVDETDSAQQIEIDTQNTRTGQYNLTVSADGLDYSELEQIFVHPGASNVEAHDVDADEDFAPLDYLGYDAPFDEDDPDSIADLQDDDYLSMNVSNSSDNFDLIANFTNLDQGEGLPDTGDYTFNFLMNDVGVEASDTVQIQGEDPTATFDRTLMTEQAGDLVNVTVDLESADHAYVQFGSEDVNFVDILYIEDDNDDQTVEFTVNTRLVGSNHTNTTRSGLLDADAVYYSEDDIVDSMIHHNVTKGETLSDLGFETGDRFDFYQDSDVDNTFGNGNATANFVDYLEELDIIDSTYSSNKQVFDQIVRPIQPGQYDMVVSEDGEFIADGGESSVDTEIGYATMDLTTPSVEDVTVHVGPEANADEFETVSELTNYVTDTRNNGEVAMDDLVVAQFEASGLTGAVAAEYYNATGNYDDFYTEEQIAQYLGNVSDENGNHVQTVWQDEGVEMVFSDEEGTGNQGDNPLDTRASGNDVSVLFDQNNDQFFVVVDSDAEPFANDLEAGDTFTTELILEHEDEDRAEFNSSLEYPADGGPVVGSDGNIGQGDDVYPYFQRDTVSSAATQFTFQEPDATFDNVEDGTVRLSPAEDATITGTTNVAPGSNAEIRVSGSGNASFLYSADVDIAEDGTFEATVDASDRSAGDQATVEFNVGGDNIAEQSVVFGEAEVETPFTPGVSIDAPSTVAPGDTMEASVTAENTGDQSGSATLTISVAGEEQFSEEVSLDAGASQSETVSYTVGEDASGSVSVSAEFGDASDSATVTVESEEPADNETEEGGNGGTPGFGVAVAALALLSAALLARFRN